MRVKTARMLAALRPAARIIAGTPSAQTAARLALVWGVTPVVVPESHLAAVRDALVARGLASPRRRARLRLRALRARPGGRQLHARRAAVALTMATPVRHSTTLLIQFILDNSLLLIIGAVAALVWANTSPDSYARVSDALRFAVNDIGMVFFFALAMKEVVEAMLPGGPLGTFRQAGVPILAAVGGMAGPALVFLFAAHWLDRPDIARGWAIPCATDIAFSYLAARFAFGRGHPAIPFLLLLAIADDAFGLIVLAIFYPSGPVALQTVVAYLAPAILVAWILRKVGIESFWAYILGPGVLTWIGLLQGGLHPALAMVPIVPFMPHEQSDLWRFGARTPLKLATLQQFEHWWRLPVQLILLGVWVRQRGCAVLERRRHHVGRRGEPDSREADRYRAPDGGRGVNGLSARARTRLSRAGRPGLVRRDRLHRRAVLRDRGVSARSGAGAGEDGSLVQLLGRHPRHWHRQAAADQVGSENLEVQTYNSCLPVLSFHLIRFYVFLQRRERDLPAARDDGVVAAPAR